MARQMLTPDELQSALHQLPGWSIHGNKLHREFTFPDFGYAFGFMAVAALHIEKINHHPEWLNVYNRVVVDLTTHDAGGLTANDIELARLLDGIAAKFAERP